MRWLAAVVALAPALARAEPAPIVGGTATGAGDFPTVVALEIGGGLCTGTLITKEWIATAAHCIDPYVIFGAGSGKTQADITAAVRAHFKTININTDPGTVAMASETIIDPMWDSAHLGRHDLGLIHLTAPVADIAPTAVNLIASHAPVGTILALVGFGITTATATTAGIEYTVANRPVVACASVNEPTGIQKTDADLLCGSQADGKGTCQGDSGGPAFAMVGGVQTLVGVDSFGDKLCAKYDAHTRLDVEAAFVLAHIPDLQCTSDPDCGDGKICFRQVCIAEPFAPGGLGTTCATDGECDTATCGMRADGLKCSATCAAADACPDGFDCLGAPQGACWPHVDGGGCCDAGRGGAPTMLLGIALVGLALRRRAR